MGNSNAVTIHQIKEYHKGVQKCETDFKKLFQGWHDAPICLKYCNSFTSNKKGDVMATFSRLTLAL